MTHANKVFCALDTPSLDIALGWANRLKGTVGGMKLGLEFFGAQGPSGIRRVAETGMPIFLDLKFHDIPNTVAQAVTSVTPLAPLLMTIHAGGGQAMMKAALDAARTDPRPSMLACRYRRGARDGGEGRCGPAEAAGGHRADQPR